MRRLSVGVIGCGYWGMKLVRNIANCPLTVVAAACDLAPARLSALHREHGDIARFGSVDALLDRGLEAVAIATPPSSHFELARRCLEAGLHVLVEKPMVTSSAQARLLIDLAARQGKVLMVDHTYLFSNPVRHIKQLIEQGELGEIDYVDSVRVNRGRFQRDANVVWDLAAHDASIIDHVLGASARDVSAMGRGGVKDDVEDYAHMHIHYDKEMTSHLHIDWLSPVKERRMVWGGSRKTLIFDDLDVASPLRIHDHPLEPGVDEFLGGEAEVWPRAAAWSPHVEEGEPLQAMVRHFAECARGERAPLSDGVLGLRVVQVLEAANRSLRDQGARVAVDKIEWLPGDRDPRSRQAGQPFALAQDHLMLRSNG